ncbi:MAG: pectin methylesterase [Lachnospiraceae bacterium]|nr:pectin methylesterase [Lachnospiraceae bacterium]
MQTILVSQTNPEAFSSLQEAILSIDDSHQEKIRIFIEPGIYEEKVFIRKENIEIVGSGREKTIFRYGDGARKPRPDGEGEYGTFNTAVIMFAGKDITVKDLTIESTAGPGDVAGQALAIYVSADRCSFHHCNFLGWQDTVFVGLTGSKPMLPDFFTESSVNIHHKAARSYFYDCFISGDVDFIFGPNVAFFEKCEIFSRKRQSEANSYITAANTPIDQEFGLVFSDCKLTGDAAQESVYLGRPWRDFAKTAFLNCHMGAHIIPEGWGNWGKIKAEAVCSYIEHNNNGPGANTEKRVPFSKQITNPALSEYFSKENVLMGEDEWNPSAE